MKKLVSTMGISIMLIALCLTFNTSPAYSGLTGMIKGKVLDAHDNPLKGAKIVLKGINHTPGNWTNKSSRKGTFRFPQLTPGEYDLTVSLKGFRKEVRSGIRVSINQTSLYKIILIPEISETDQ